jgi:tRNA G18 (ribose-2'-O)-methylase SpoU
MTDVRLRSHLEVERGLFMAESFHVIERALEAGCRPRSFLMAPKWLEHFRPLIERSGEVPVYVGEEGLLESITGFHLHRGALAAMQRPVLPTLEQILAGAELSSTRRSRIAVLEDVVDHTNVGAMFRSAAALGVDSVLVTPRCADPLYRRSIRVSMGTVFQVPWTRIDPWPEGIGLLQDAGYTVAGMTLGEGAISLDDLVIEEHPRLALVFGTEGHGLTERADRRLDRRVTIPMMHGVDSLNVAASSAVAFYATR